MISALHRCIFVHIERTGGTSIELALTGFDWWESAARAEKHLTAEQCRRRYGIDTWRRYTTFAFVRDPWDLVVSSYAFFCSRKRSTLRGMSFREYVLSAGDAAQRVDGDGWTHGGWWHDRGVCQLDWIVDRDGALLVDYVGRFETLQADFDAICAATGRPSPPLPHEGRSERRPYTDYYDPQTRGLVERLFRRDIERFGYAFGTPPPPRARPFEPRDFLPPPACGIRAGGA
ncbi:MAG: sulfotransferase family 2 domain-containing protein [Deltaproteobacteria bacterium]|nr:sulfotransferase family 2 domain-containing protein [Deltaproteobacteria bacterium]